MIKRNKRNWLYNAPFPPILLKYPNIINENTCKPYKLNKVAGELLTNLNLKCETVAIILSSSVTFHKRAVKIYDLIKRNNNQHEICVFVLTNEFAGIQDLDMPIISRSSNESSWIGEKLYQLTLNYEVSGRGSKLGFQERVAEFTTLFALPCLSSTNFKYILLFDDDTIFNPNRYVKLLQSNELLKSAKNVFAGKRWNDCNVLCGGAGMLFGRDVMIQMRLNVKLFYQFYSRYYSQYVDVRLTRFTLEALKLQPIHIEEFLNDPPDSISKTTSMESFNREIQSAVTIHHMDVDTKNFYNIVKLFYEEEQDDGTLQ